LFQTHPKIGSAHNKRRLAIGLSLRVCLKCVSRKSGARLVFAPMSKSFT